ncbi:MULTISPECIES: metallophosphoesterase [unclassified Curtobacterium]|uniref:metallophosphoesterase family protein n=1 Tax=unclassified Curtobacterium TaxID=257496 RepID=UPI000DAABE1A|nr:MULTISPECIES: YfcE family phosphodiesterase [unclassified Curtobacterium]PZE61171.1 YfcE family phosphodiesterase [Curtobacterium sp. MCPF17_001]WIB12371.1 YfcE family phosphodiesterase [Curtobacterium sp. MCPF17_052]
MSTSLVLLSDTHLPKRAKDLPPELWADIDAADLVVHAGDWVDLATVDLLEARSRELLAVRGNNDLGFEERLPLVAARRVESLRFAVVHETGAATGRERRAETDHPDVDVLVFGHSHIPWDSTAPNGMRLLNPGSPTDRRRQPDHTWMRCKVDGSEIRVTLVRRAPGADGIRLVASPEAS